VVAELPDEISAQLTDLNELFFAGGSEVSSKAADAVPNRFHFFLQPVDPVVVDASS
jgi:hypothetical protein